jgi:hypothetical protein
MTDLTRYVVEADGGELVLWCADCRPEVWQLPYTYGNEGLYALVAEADAHERERHAEGLIWKPIPTVTIP